MEGHAVRDAPGAQGAASRSVAYVLKAYPRRSEIFIASEIHRLEQAGLTLRLYSLMPRDEAEHHDVVDRIRAQPCYLPATTPTGGIPLRQWLRANLLAFMPSLKRVARRRPSGLARATAVTIAHAYRTRSSWSGPRVSPFRELLRAVTLADGLSDQPDVAHLHAHFAHSSTTVTWLASMITGLPFSFTGHAKDIYERELNPAGLLRRKLEAARFVVTCTEANGRYLRGLAPGATVHCVRHGINADFKRLLARHAGPAPPPERLRLLGVGRLVPKKGFDTLVDACAVLAERGVDFEAAIAGEDGEHSGRVRARIDELGLAQRVRLLGPLSQAQLHDQYRRSSVLCMPSRVLDNGDRDGIPNVVLEAMACGVPVVATAVSGIPEAVEDGVTGLLVRPDDPHALADAVMRIQKDPHLAYRLGRDGQRLVEERFDGDQLARELAAIFMDAVSKGGGP